MKKYIKNAKKFLEFLNHKIKDSNTNRTQDEDYKHLYDEISDIQKLFKYDKSKIKREIRCNESIDKQNLLILVKKNRILALLSKIIEKTHPKHNNQNEIVNNGGSKSYNNNEIKCFGIPIKFKKITEYKIVSTEDIFIEMLNYQYHFIVDVFNHSYRTYTPFVCYFTVISSEGVCYIIDALKYRDIIIKSGLWTCKYKKYFIDMKSVTRVQCDFQKIENFEFLNLTIKYKISINVGKAKERMVEINEETYVDWRISGIEKLLFDLIKERSYNIIDAYNQYIECSKVEINNMNIASGNISSICQLTNNKCFLYKKYTEEDLLYIEKNNGEYINIMCAYFEEKYNLVKDEYLVKLIQNRELVAKVNNESIYYVMPNTQLVYFHKKGFREISQIIRNNLKLSPILKQNINLFLI